MSERAKVEPPPLDVAPEVAVGLELDGRRVTTWLCTPQRLDVLAAGWLRCEGIVRRRSQLKRLEVAFDPPLVRAELEPGTLARSRLPGPDGRLPVAPHDIVPEPPRPSPRLRALLADAVSLRRLFAEMYERATLRERGGGLHTGGWVEDARLQEVVEDVGRQNVVDKLVGAAFLAGRPVADALLLLSGRISGMIAAKGWRSGVAALASLSIPTTLARDLAARAGIVLVGRARGEPQIHWL